MGVKLFTASPSSLLRLLAPLSNLLFLLRLEQRFSNFFECDPNLSEHLWPKPQTAYSNMKKMMIVWMSFGSKLLYCKILPSQNIAYQTTASSFA